MFYHPLLDLVLQFKNVEKSIKEKYHNYAFLSFILLALFVLPLILFTKNQSHVMIEILSAIAFVFSVFIFHYKAKKNIIECKNRLLKQIDILLEDKQLKEKLKITTKFIFIKNETVDQTINFNSTEEIINHILKYEKEYTQLTLLSHSKEVLGEIQEDVMKEKMKKFSNYQYE
jgi:hypothetical protein